MSSRQLRKLQQQRDLEAQIKQQQEDEDVSEDEPVAPVKTKASLFANLAALEDEVEEDEEEEEEEQSKSSETPVQSTTSALSSTAAKSKKSKKKKKKAKSKNNAANETASDGDDIDAALKELAIENGSKNDDQKQQKMVDPAYDRVCQLLGINFNHLKVGTEMRNLFGKGVMDNHDDAGGAVPRRARRQQAAQQQVDLETALKGRHAPGKGLPELTLRRNIFVQGKDDWPRAAGTLKWELTPEDGFQADPVKREVFGRFVHDKTYQDLQQNFHAFVEMGDPQNLIGLLQRNPYHISLLLQVSKVAKDQSDHSLSSDLLERALFTFARATNSAFSTALTAGKLRLDFARPENRELWLAGYQYIKSLVMKGTYRTALEWAKLLLSLSPAQDPYCIRLMIHHLALRASESRWLLDLYSSTSDENLTSEKRIDSHVTPSLALAAAQIKDGAQARLLLRQSMSKLPWLFSSLFSALNLDAPPSIWGVQPRTDAEKLFTELYIAQCKDLWNTPEATSLLMEIAHTIPPVNVDDIPVTSNETMTLDVVRFIYLDNNPALMRLVPSSLLHRENNSDSDPLPPYHNTYSYAAQRRFIERGNSGQPGFNRGFDNPLAAIARLIPGFNRAPEGEAPRARTDDEIDQDELRRGLEGIVRGENGAGGAAADGERMPRTVAQTLLDMLGWGRGTGSAEEDEDEDEYLEAEGDEGSDGEFVDAAERQNEDDGRAR